MAINEGKWGRAKARERYQSGGDVPPIKIIPPGVSGLSKAEAAKWRSNTKPGSMSNMNIRDKIQTGGRGGAGPSLVEERKMGGKVKHADVAQDKKLIKKMINEKAAGKFARGGRARGKGNTNINIVIAPQDKEAAPPMPPPMPMPMMAPKPPMAPPPIPAGGGGMPGMKRGGKVMTAGAESGVGRLQKAGFDYKSVRRG